MIETPERVMVLAAPWYAADLEATGDERHWLALLGAVQQVVPGASSLRPGWCAMRARGPARYYGSEDTAARAVLECAVASLGKTPGADSGRGSPLVRVGVASGRFAAQQAVMAGEHDQAVRSPDPGIRIVEAADTAAFLSPLPVARAADEQLAAVLSGLGVRTLGAFAALPEAAVLQRFGANGIAAHRRARGLGEQRAAEVAPAAPVRDLSHSFAFEPPLDAIDQLAFASGAHAEAFVQRLAGFGLVCTELLVELVDDRGLRHERLWSHPGNFTATDVVNRVRWQAVALPGGAGAAADLRGGAGIAGVRVTPARTAKAAAHEPGLWSTAPDERVHHQLTRVQSLVGHEGVGTGRIVGGRASEARQVLLPWGSAVAPDAARSSNGPWPGQLTGALPSAVFDVPLDCELLDERGSPVVIDEDELLVAPPHTLMLAGRNVGTVRAWSAPWPLREGWWRSTENAQRSNATPVPPQRQPTERSEGWRSTENAPRSNATPVPPGTVHRLQVLLEQGDAWLLRLESERGWQAEGRYV